MIPDAGNPGASVRLQSTPQYAEGPPNMEAKTTPFMLAHSPRNIIYPHVFKELMQIS
jgi:hypothetical protein